MDCVLPEFFLAHFLNGMVLNDCQVKCNKTYQCIHKFRKEGNNVKLCFFTTVKKSDYNGLFMTTTIFCNKYVDLIMESGLGCIFPKRNKDGNS